MSNGIGYRDHLCKYVHSKLFQRSYFSASKVIPWNNFVVAVYFIACASIDAVQYSGLIFLSTGWQPRNLLIFSLKKLILCTKTQNNCTSVDMCTAMGSRQSEYIVTHSLTGRGYSIKVAAGVTRSCGAHLTLRQGSLPHSSVYEHCTKGQSQSVQYWYE